MVELHQPELRRILSPNPIQQQLVLAVGSLVSLWVGLFILIPNAWVPALQEKGIIYSIIDVFASRIGFLSHFELYLLFLGLFFGGAILWFLDTYKFIHGGLLWSGFLVSLILFSISWNEPVDAELTNGIILFLIGTTVILQFLGIPLLERYTRLGDKKRLLTRRPRDFKRAVKFTAMFVAVVAGLGLVQVLIDGHGTQTQIQYGTATMFVLAPLYVFQRYAHEEKIIQLGPARSGKTSVQGGLYKSVDQPIEKESPLLDEIVEEYMNKGKFPNRTQINFTDWQQYTIELPHPDTDTDDSQNSNSNNNQNGTLIIEFSYVTRQNLLFPKKRTITAIDYPGELLTGLGDAPPLSECIAAQEKKDWDGVLANWRQETNEKDSDSFMQEFSHLVMDADWILFTTPMDDFLENLIHDRPNHIPKYHREALYKIEQSENSDESKYNEIKLDNQSNSTKLDNHQDYWLGKSRYYFRDKNERAHPDEYLTEYTKVINNLEDTRNHNFLWVATMADLVHNDFDTHFEFALNAKFKEKENVGKIEVDGNDIYIDPGIDIDVDIVRTLFNGDTNSNWVPASETYTMLFARWIMGEYISEYGPHVEQKMLETYERHMFPVWFEITDSEENEFETRTKPVLKGSQHVLSRLNGKRLKENYPSKTKVLKHKYLGGEEAISATTMGYEVLTAIKDSDVDV